jgi:hypothetical protein
MDPISTAKTYQPIPTTAAPLAFSEDLIIMIVYWDPLGLQLLHSWVDQVSDLHPSFQ